MLQAQMLLGTRPVRLMLEPDNCKTTGCLECGTEKGVCIQGSNGKKKQMNEHFLSLNFSLRDSGKGEDMIYHVLLLHIQQTNFSFKKRLNLWKL